MATWICAFAVLTTPTFAVQGASVGGLDLHRPGSATGNAQPIPGTPALDLAAGWNFANSYQRNEARQILNEAGPRFLVLALPSTSLPPDGSDAHQDVCTSLAIWQYRTGRGFILERRPSHGSDEFDMLADLPGVTTFAQGSPSMGPLRVVDPVSDRKSLNGHALATNVPEVARTLYKRALRDHADMPEDMIRELLPSVMIGLR